MVYITPKQSKERRILRCYTPQNETETLRFSQDLCSAFSDLRFAYRSIILSAGFKNMVYITPIIEAIIDRPQNAKSRIES